MTRVLYSIFCLIVVFSLDKPASKHYVDMIDSDPPCPRLP